MKRQSKEEHQVEKKRSALGLDRVNLNFKIQRNFYLNTAGSRHFGGRFDVAKRCSFSGKFMVARQHCFGENMG